MSPELAKAFVNAQKNFAPALKTSTNPHFRSKYVDLSGCVEAVIDALNAAGIALLQNTHESDDGVIVETIFLHESGETLSCGKLHVPASKKDAQGYGSALTYARRYSLMAACGIAPEDDDGNAASRRPVEPVKPAATPMPAKVKEAVKPKKTPPPAIEGTAKTVSGDPNEGNLDDIGTSPALTDKADPVVLSNIVNAFASKLNMTADQIEEALANWMEAAQVKPLSDWTNKDVDEAREMFKSMMAHKQEVL